MMTTLRKSHRPALPVGEAPVVQHLQQDVEHVRMRFFDLVEQHDLIGPTAHGFGQRAAFLIADIAGRRADQARDRMLFHIFRHVEPDHRRFVVEQERAKAFVSSVLPTPVGRGT